MSNFSNDVEPEWPEDFGPPDEDIVMRPRGPPRNQRYSNAYGDYRGGYGPGEGYGPRPRFFRQGPPGPGPFGPPGPFPPPGRYGPPNLFGPPPPDVMWGRGGRPAEERGLRYLMRCGVPRESLRNLPRDLLQMMESDYCGVCAAEFESFASSRAHYLSKNHLKKQGKWLLMRSDADSRRGKEIPMKARELYCELCDVHITSKQHASSHYLGKPHRAIVEGRKQPKNPMLIQGHMRERLDQLIRREKKHMKSDEEQKVAEEPQDNKPPLKELTCVICKIAVTCTEQMTIHLNGKKHLTKEKQHILNVMKGPVDDPVAVKTECADAEDNEGEGEVVAEETQEWSENWD